MKKLFMVVMAAGFLLLSSGCALKIGGLNVVSLESTAPVRTYQASVQTQAPAYTQPTYGYMAPPVYMAPTYMIPPTYYNPGIYVGFSGRIGHRR